MSKTPEQQARDAIDDVLTRCGWTVQNKDTANLPAGCTVLPYANSCSKQGNQAIRNDVTTVVPREVSVVVHETDPWVKQAMPGQQGIQC